MQELDPLNTMKIRLLIRISIIVSVVLLCTGFGVYSFLKLNAVENQKDFDLYSLVPDDAIAVLETDHMAQLVQNINHLKCSKDHHFLYASDLFVYLKRYLHTLLEDTPHGLSRQMNKMLLSFHAPDTPMNQVLYCSLGTDDYELVELFIKKYCSSAFPMKVFNYRGKEIRIYAMSNGRFLATYVTSKYLVVSFQKRLIEKVIDLKYSKKSLLKAPAFSGIHDGKRADVEARIYVRMAAVDMGKRVDSIPSQWCLGTWGKFDLKLNENAIYCSGASHFSGKSQAFINILHAQKPIDGFPGGLLPSTTFFYNCWAVSDMNVMLKFMTSQEYAKVSDSNGIKKCDRELIDFLKSYGESKIITCLFKSKDTLKNGSYSLMIMPMKQKNQAEYFLRKFSREMFDENAKPSVLQKNPESHYFYRKSGKKCYLLPHNILFTRLTGLAEVKSSVYACFYDNNLLMAPDVDCLLEYIRAIESKDLLKGTASYEEGIGSLSPSYNFIMMGDMEKIMSQPDVYVRLIPNFFFRQSDFFRHFMLSIQFTCLNDMVYPNIVLLYKNEI